MKPVTVVSAILIAATALTLALVIALKTPYFSSIFGNKTDSTNPDTVAGIVEAGGNAVFVFDQEPSDKVLVNGVQLQSPGFVVIHENEDETPGTYIGVSQLLSAGTTNSIEVALQHVVNEETTLFAILYKDNGDGKFDIETDVALKDSLGNQILGVFEMVTGAETPVEVSY